MAFRRPNPSSPAGRALALAESRLGVAVVDRTRYSLLEEVAVDYHTQERMLDLMGWNILDNYSGREQEVKYESRKTMARKSRIAWINDPMVGGAVSLMNDFALGRGVPKPRCNDPKVQEWVDEAWDDPDNQRVLTGFLAQIAVNTDISLQSNMLFLLFDDGDDGRVKLSTLNYDTVEEIVTDPENRHRALWYVAKERKVEWDFKEHKWKSDITGLNEKAIRRYYEHWHNVEDAEDEDRDDPLVKPDEGDMGKGKVYHVAINKTTEMQFGVPEWQRVLKWATAYNDFMKSRVDMVKAAAAFAMKRKVTGTPNQVRKLAAQTITGRGPLAAFPVSIDDPPVGLGLPPYHAGATITENESVTHESLKLDSGAANAQLDAANLRSQFSAATRWPQHYLGAGDGPGLATATAMELPVLKMVETRQEVLEGIYRWFIDRVIERAVETGKIPKNADPQPDEQEPLSLQQALVEHANQGDVRIVSINRVPALSGRKRVLLHTRKRGMEDSYQVLMESHEDKSDDERETERDLGYTFGLPSPLRRMMADLISGIANIARTFDPNNTNLALSKHLLYVALGEGLEIENAMDMVEEIFPPGYEDPAIAAAQAQAGGGDQPNFFGPGGGTGADGQQHGDGNPYGAPMQATPAEKVPGAQEAAMPVIRRDGTIRWMRLREGRMVELPEDVVDEASMRAREVEDHFRDVLSVARDEVTALTVVGSNGNGSSDHRAKV